jgi:hypothetical protein
MTGRSVNFDGDGVNGDAEQVDDVGDEAMAD